MNLVVFKIIVGVHLTCHYFSCLFSYFHFCSSSFFRPSKWAWTLNLNEELPQLSQKTLHAKMSQRCKLGLKMSFQESGRWQFRTVQFCVFALKSLLEWGCIKSAGYKSASYNSGWGCSRDRVSSSRCRHWRTNYEPSSILLRQFPLI